ncbi:MAG TPA: hypothetical protein VFX98_18705 [Longimicrobiaceae bacterium]|nr:hypothetical protein [Longimicrobiaceae bacterium]
MPSENVICTSCGAVNTPEASACARCGGELATAKLQQSLAALQRLNQRMQATTGKGTPSFSSFNGFGTTLLDYRPRGDGTYDTVRWVIALSLPIFPLSGYHIQPIGQERGHGGETARFNLLGKTPLSAARVLRTYLLAVVGLLPIVLGILYSDAINRALSGGMAVLLMLACGAWGIYFIFFKLKNEGDAYKLKPVPLP